LCRKCQPAFERRTFRVQLMKNVQSERERESLCGRSACDMKFWCVNRPLACSLASAIFVHLNPFKIDVSIKTWFTAGNSRATTVKLIKMLSSERVLSFTTFISAQPIRGFIDVRVWSTLWMFGFFAFTRRKWQRTHYRRRGKEETRQQLGYFLRNEERENCLVFLFERTSRWWDRFWEKNKYLHGLFFFSLTRKRLRGIHKLSTLCWRKTQMSKSTLLLVAHFILTSFFKNMLVAVFF